MANLVAQSVNPQVTFIEDVAGVLTNWWRIYAASSTALRIEHAVGVGTWNTDYDFKSTGLDIQVANPKLEALICRDPFLSKHVTRSGLIPSSQL